MSSTGNHLAPALVFVALTLLLLPAGSLGLSPHPSGHAPRGVPRGAGVSRTAPTATPLAASPIGPSTPIGSAYIDLWNNTPQSGFPPVTGSTVLAESMAFDPIHDLVYVGGNNNLVGSINLSTGKLGKLYSSPGQAAALAYDPASQIVFWGMPGSSTQLEAINTSTGANASVSVGTSTSALLDDPSTGRVYSANYNSANVSVIEARNETVVATIGIGGSNSEPNALAKDSATDQLLVGESGAFSMAIVNLSSRATWRTVTVGNDPDAIAIDPVTNFAYVANYNSATVSVVNLTSATLLTTINVPTDPTCAVYDPLTRTVWVGSDGPTYTNLTVIDTTNNSVGSTFSSGSPTALVYTPAPGEILSANFGRGAVVVYNATNNSRVAFDEVGVTPSDVALDPENGTFYVTDNEAGIEVFNLTTWSFVETMGPPLGWNACAYDAPSNELVAIDGADQLGIFNLSSGKLAALIALGSFAYQVVIDPRQNFAFVTNAYSNNVSVVNLTSNTLVGSVGVGQQPIGETFDPVNDTVFVGDQASNDVYVIQASNLSVVETFSAGCNPTGLAYAAKTNLVYVSLLCTNRLAEFNASTYGHVRTLGVGSAPESVVDDPLGDAVLCQNSNSGNISVVGYSTGTIVTSINGSALSMAIDNRTNTMYAADTASGLVSILGFGESQIDFRERGLPNGTVWSVNLSGASRGFASPILPFLARSGTDTFTIGPAGGMLPTPTRGIVKVSGVTVVQKVRFGVPYSVRFKETGLAAGQNWTVALNGTLLRSNTTSLGTEEPNGTYSYSVAAVGRFAPLVPSGSFSVLGSNISINLTFVDRFPVSFAESGLPVGTNWSVSVNRTYDNASSSGTLTLLLPNGTGYRFAAANLTDFVASPSAGTFNVTGGAVNLSIRFLRLFEVTFTEQGLPSGTTWKVSLNGSGRNASTDSLRFNETNGTYKWTIGPIAGYTTNWSGVATVNGTAVGINVTFTQVDYTVIFNESGLPTGTNWTVKFGSTTESTVGTGISFTAPNGTYAWSIVPVPGFTTRWSGSSVLSGRDIVVNVTFAPFRFPVSFAETGLPAGTSWTVSLDGNATTSTGATVSFDVPNGTYVWSIVPIPGFHANWTGSVTVLNSSRTVIVPFVLATYEVEFSEVGLAGGTNWSVSLAGVSRSTLGSSLGFVEPNGSYAYAVVPIPGWAATPRVGTAMVDGGPVNVSISWLRVTYPVQYTEVGLPAGDGWWVNLTGSASVYSTSASLTLPAPNGSYVYTVAPADKSYRSTGGMVRVAGGPSAVNVQFTQVTYSIEFNESGLPRGGSWWINISGGPSLQGSGSDLSATEMNGTYSYSIGSGNKEYAAAGGTVAVEGRASVILIDFHLVLYAVSFSESGLPTDVLWAVTVNGVTVDGAGTLSSSDLPNGSYSYEITAPTGFLAVPANGTVEVNGSAATVSTSFQRVPVAASGGAVALEYGLIAAAAGAAVIATLIVARRRRSRSDDPTERTDEGEGSPVPAEEVPDETT
jgi:YVTN family beta-propeller protein